MPSNSRRRHAQSNVRKPGNVVSFSVCLVMTGLVMVTPAAIVISIAPPDGWSVMIPLAFMGLGGILVLLGASRCAYRYIKGSKISSSQPSQVN